MSTMMADQPDTVAADAPPARRAARYAAQRYLWQASSRPRGRACGLRSTAGVVELRVSGRGATSTGGFAGLQTCGSVWSCPVCSAKVLAERQSEVEAAVSGWSGRVAFMTFTVRHTRDDSLDDVWNAVTAAHHRMTTGGTYQAQKRRFGVATTRVVQSGARRGQTVATSVLPWLRVVECTHGDANGWHVHQHMLVFLPAGTTDDELADLYASMHARWSLGAAEAGLDGALMVNVAKFVDGSASIGSYVTKNTYTPAQTAALEVARGDLKSGRLGNRSAMQILRDLVEHSRSRDRMLWHDFERVSAGRRQMTWSVGARDVLGLGVERDDETIAADEVGTTLDAVCTFDAADYRRGIALRGRRVELLDAVEISPAAALALLDSWGVPYTVAAVVDRRPSVLDPHRHLRAADVSDRRLTGTRDALRALRRPTVVDDPPPAADTCPVCAQPLAAILRHLGRHALC